MTTEVWTIGHSTLAIEDFLERLRHHRIEVLADVRRFPHSRRHPHFNTEPVKKSLFHEAIRYEYLGDELGGFRTARPDSPHTGLRESSFQGYADHLSTPVFAKGLARLETLASARRVAYMCSERNPRSCHRKILSDALMARGWNVHHILDAAPAEEHKITMGARVVDGGLLYAARPLEEFGPDAEEA